MNLSQFGSNLHLSQLGNLLQFDVDIKCNQLNLRMCLVSQGLDYKLCVDWLARNLSKDFALATTLQTTCCTLSHEVHALAISGPYKENQQSLSMRMPHCHIMPLKDEALQHLWQTSKLSLTPII
jgi:hypothetical protein